MPARRRPIPVVFVLVVLVVLVVLDFAVGSMLPAGAQGPNPEPERPDPSPLSILGPSRMDAAALVASYRAAGHTPRLTVPLDDLARMFVEEGAAYGVRADIAWAQSLVETGWFTYPAYGQVRPDDNNFAGIGAYDGGRRGFTYPDARAGVRAQMQLLAQYASTAEIDDALVHAPASKRGAVTTWLEMGDGNWATSPRYARAVIGVYADMLESAGASLLSPGLPASPSVAREGEGIWLAAVDGYVYDTGDARFWGSAGGTIPDVRVVDIAATPTAGGYWMVTDAGDVGVFGDAVRWGSARGIVSAPVIGIAATRVGSGYWVASSSGEVVAFGDAPAVAPGPERLARMGTIVAIAATPTGGGYWLVDADGRVVAVGDAVHHGELPFGSGGDPVVDLAPTPGGDGYWLVTIGGEIHAFGAAADLGSLADANIANGTGSGSVRMVVGVQSTPTGEGYWIVSTDGFVAARGDAPAFGARDLLGGPVVAVDGRFDVVPRA